MLYNSFVGRALYDPKFTPNFLLITQIMTDFTNEDGSLNQVLLGSSPDGGDPLLAERTILATVHNLFRSHADQCVVTIDTEQKTLYIQMEGFVPGDNGLTENFTLNYSINAGTFEERFTLRSKRRPNDVKYHMRVTPADDTSGAIQNIGATFDREGVSTNGSFTSYIDYIFMQENPNPRYISDNFGETTLKADNALTILQSLQQFRKPEDSSIFQPTLASITQGKLE